MSTTYLHGHPIEVGDKVWSISHGWGVVVDTNLTRDYPFHVRFNDLSGTPHLRSFDATGKEHSWNPYPTLLWEPIKYTVPSKPCPPVMEYKALKLDRRNDVFSVSDGWYSTIEEARGSIYGAYTVVQLIEQSRRVRIPK